MSLVKEKLDDIDKRLVDLVKIVKLCDKKRLLVDLEKKSQTADFWQDNIKAQKLMRKLSETQQEIESIESLKEQLSQIKSLAATSQPEEVESLSKEIDNIDQELKVLEKLKYFNEQYDHQDAILSIHAGQGGTEAMDWTAMLKRMYLRFAEKKGWQVKIINETLGEEAGIKSVTMTIEGKSTYGYLKKEKGTHRLVRLSPFNADNLRQTSFALVEIMPVIEESGEIEVKDDDLQVEFFRSSGSGGQNVNKVSTAVRLKHKPTQIVIEAQVQRTQEQNRKIAMKLLLAKLWELEEEKRQKKEKQIKGEHKHASWGNQIRSYVLHPYKQVKDLRTEYTSRDPEAVLDGGLDGFIEAELRLE